VRVVPRDSVASTARLRVEERKLLQKTTQFQLAFALSACAILGTATAVATSRDTFIELPPVALVSEALKLPADSTVLKFTEPVLRLERVQRGDNFAAILNRLGISDAEFSRYVRAESITKPLMNLRAGRVVAAKIDEQGRVTRFDVVTETGATTAIRLTIIRDINGGFSAVEDEFALERQVETKVAEIQSTLFAATDAVGIPDSVAIQVADIFGAEVDFNKELRKGDTIRVVFERLRLPDSLDQPIPGRVLAVEFNHLGKRFEAQWFERAAGTGEYFAPNGASLKKAFLRSPLEVSRITSGFTMARLNPVNRSWSAHKGVDMAAPTGTNIRVSGDGVVDFVGKQSGYGNVVIVKHGKRYETLYAHLNDFADNLRVGQKVRQGDIIGSVGTTGWATGPHLHYEFKIDGEHVDPMSAALPLSEPLTASERSRFNNVSSSYQSKLAFASKLMSARFE
jgi:murein DD-endopeptidase MepM/ murein hydrolase activator NlpD